RGVFPRLLRRQRNIDGDRQFGHELLLRFFLVDGVLRGFLCLVDRAGILALRLLVDDVAGLLDGLLDLVSVLLQMVLGLVQESHQPTLSFSIFNRTSDILPSASYLHNWRFSPNTLPCAHHSASINAAPTRPMPSATPVTLRFDGSSMN
ncbi:hypothetical protein, partial [Streptomyces sp. DSM 41978]|uniref:hypothetical protein n=1 Tax=Streptomyces sp. DSM 41978 TaxID=3448658 RepID=UPI00404020FD